MAVFIRKDCKEELHSKGPPWFLKEAEIERNENLYFNDRKPISTCITRHDILSTSDRNHFKDVIINQFIQLQCQNVNGAISTISYLIPSIAQSHFSYEYYNIFQTTRFNLSRFNLSRFYAIFFILLISTNSATFIQVNNNCLGHMVII